MNYLELFESFTQKVINNTKETTQEKKREQIVAINFKDPEVERICHEHGVYSIQDAAGVTKISNWFSENSDIKTFDEFKYFTGIKTIEYKAFSFCTGLQSITIPNRVSGIEESAFHYCPSLQSITIPDGVTSIEYGAFYRCTSLQSVVIPSSVTIIKERAFMYCKSLQSINIPNSVTSIEECTFIECKALKTINIPNSVTRIGSLAFQGCTSLQSINIPNSVTSIGIRAFYECSSLQSINIPNSVTSIGGQAFEDCRSLQSVTIPNSVTSIGERPFGNCNDIWKINISKNCPEYDQIKKEYPYIQLVDPSEMKESFTKNVINKVKSTTQEDKRQIVTNIPFEDPEVELICHEHGVYTYKDARQVSSVENWFYKNDNIKSFNEFKYFTGLKDIEDRTFYNCSSLQSINIPDSVTSIEIYAFSGCSSLQSITIPDSVTIIEINAFFGCTSLKSINIPDSVTYIGYGAFTGCLSLQSIYISKDSPVYDQIKKQYPNIQLVDPSEMNESFTKDAIKKVKSASQEDKRKQIFDEFVNLGLPSGILWSRYNYGADDIYDFGKKLSYDNAKQLVKSIGSNVWIPSQKEYGELFGNCYKRSIMINGVKCLELTSKINGETIIFPCIGSSSSYWARTCINSSNLANIVEIYSHGAVDWDDESYDSNFKKHLVRMIKDNE